MSRWKFFNKWTASSEFGTYRLCEQRRFRQACASPQSRQNLRCSLIQAVSQEEPSDRKPDPWLLWMAWHAHLKFVLTECSKTQIRLTGLKCYYYATKEECVFLLQSTIFIHSLICSDITCNRATTNIVKKWKILHSGHEKRVKPRA